MCSVHEGDGDPVVKLGRLSKLPRSCVKCGAKALHAFGTNASFCSVCFDKSFTHKFRAAMGKNPLVRNGDRVLLAYSGGISSSALLHLIKQGLSPSAPKKLKFDPGLIFIDERSVITNEESSDALDKIRDIMKESGFPFHIAKLEEVFTTHGDSLESIEEACKRLTSLLNSTSTLTAKLELVYRLRCQLLSQKALSLNYKHVFLAENSTRLATKILSNVAQGRGAHLFQDTGFSDGSRFDAFGVNLLRPLRDLSAKEIVMYNALHRIETVFLPNLSTLEVAHSSIPNLTEAFLQGLMSNFPSTEMTVYRLSNKVRPSENKSRERINDEESASILRKCRLCLGYVADQKASCASAEQDLLFTEKLLTHGLRDSDYSALLNQLPKQEARCDICYSCSLLLGETEDTEFLNKLPSTSRAYSNEQFLSKLQGVVIAD